MVLAATALGVGDPRVAGAGGVVVLQPFCTGSIAGDAGKTSALAGGGHPSPSADGGGNFRFCRPIGLPAVGDIATSDQRAGAGNSGATRGNRTSGTVAAAVGCR